MKKKTVGIVVIFFVVLFVGFCLFTMFKVTYVTESSTFNNLTEEKYIESFENKTVMTIHVLYNLKTEEADFKSYYDKDINSVPENQRLSLLSDMREAYGNAFMEENNLQYLDYYISSPKTAQIHINATDLSYDEVKSLVKTLRFNTKVIKVEVGIIFN